MTVRIRSVNGGAEALEAFRKALATAPKVLDSMSRDMAEEALGLIKDEFRSESDPYGKPWQPKKVSDGRKTLSGKTSRLKGGWHVVQTSKRGFTVAPSVTYAAFHQTGTARMPRRAMVPYGPLPPAWRRAFAEVAEEHFKAHFSSSKPFSAKAGRGLVAGKITGLKRQFNWKGLLRKAVRAMGE